MSTFASALCAVAQEAVAVAPLPPSVRWTNSTPIAFVKDHHLRLYFTIDGFMFSTKWKPSRVAAQEYHYVSATVECDESPPSLPSVESVWRPVRVMGFSDSERLLRSAASHLTPTNTSHGIYAQFAMGDAVLFRGPTGEVKAVRFEERPLDLIIDKRYGRQEIASALVQAMEADLRANYPNETRFLAMWSFGVPRLTYLDLEQREAVVLLVPSPNNVNRPVLGKNLKTLASFALLDNGWSFLKNPISSATRTLHQGLQWTATIFDPKLRSRGSTIPPLTNAPGMDLTTWEQWLDKHCDTPRERGAVRLLINGEKFFPHFERRLTEAESNINIHICIFDRDDVAVQLADLLKARSKDVEVKVVFDRLNSNGAGGVPPATPMPANFVPPASVASYLRDGSHVQVRPQLNPGLTCDHSKIFLIDQRYAYIGGMNFGREYRYEWHDLMAEVEGPIVTSFQKQFDKKWAQTGVWGDCGLAAQALCGKASVRATTEPPDSIELRRLYTKTFGRQIRSAQLAAIKRARNHIFLENAYLYSNDMIVALVHARLRGVDVRVIMPGENDFDSGHSSNLVTANYLRRHGIRVYFFPGMSHVKALLVDGWVCFGSANFDALSLRLNRECNLATSDAGFAKTFRREVFDADIARSREVIDELSVDFRDHISDALLNPF